MEGRAITQLMELSEDQAAEAVEKFSAADLDTIRSKTGFLMGIIKRVREEGRFRGGGGGGGGYGGGGGGGYGGGGYGVSACFGSSSVESRAALWNPTAFACELGTTFQ